MTLRLLQIDFNIIPKSQLHLRLYITRCKIGPQFQLRLLTLWKTYINFNTGEAANNLMYPTYNPWDMILNAFATMDPYHTCMPLLI